MKIIERVLLVLYAELLRLYPRSFRREFAAEMQTVFGDALRSASRQGPRAVLRLCAREAAQLPVALAREHWQSAREKEAGMDNSVPIMAAAGKASPESGEAPVRRRREILAGLLPFLLVLLTDGLPRLLVATGLVTWDKTAQEVMNAIMAVLASAGLLAAFLLAQRWKWPAWSATWYPFFVLVPVALGGMVANAVFGKNAGGLVYQDLAIYLLFPLALAALLYGVTRRSPLRGLLAALPVLYLLWQPNMEFVPDTIEYAIKVPSLALFCLTVALLLRSGNWRGGLLAVLAVNLVVGALFAYAGIYHGGSLPFVAGRPSLVEVARSLIPQYLAVGAILLGPLFALRIRQAGRSGGPAAQAGYHLALLGLLLVILANLGGLMAGMGDNLSSLKSTVRNLAPWMILLGLAAYLLGLFIIYRDLPPARRVSGLARRGLLALLPLVIPMTFMLPFITWTRPVSELYGTPLVWGLPHGVSLGLGLGWLALSVWVVMWERQPARPAEAGAGA